MNPILGEVIASLIDGVIQYGIMDSNVEKQNEYNQQMYGEHGSPAARSREMKQAGMSDAGIGQALAGSTAPAINLTSAPRENMDISGILNSISEIGKREKEKEVMDYNIDEIKANCKLILQRYDTEKNVTAHEWTNWQIAIQELMQEEDKTKITEIERQIQENVAKNVVQLSNMEVKKGQIMLEQMRVALEKEKYAKDIQKFYAYFEKYKALWLKYTGIPYDDFKLSKDPMKIIEVVIKTIGGNLIQSFKDEANTIDDYSNPEESVE